MLKQRWWFVAPILLIFMILLGCGSESQDKGNSHSEQVADKAATEEALPAEAPGGFSEGGTSESEQQSAFQRKIIKQAEIRQKVTELEPGLQLVQQLVDQSGGYIQSSTIQQYGENEREAVFILRVPQVNYMSVVDQLQKIGKSVMISHKGEDVTDQYYDNEARMKNLSLQEQAVQNLLLKAEKMEDILKIQQELFRLRGEIEALQGKNRVIDHLSNLSTINLSILEVKAVDFAEDSPLTQAREGFVQSLGGVGDFFVQLAVLVVTYLPFVLFVYLPLGLIVWWFIRRHKKKTEHKDKSHS